MSFRSANGGSSPNSSDSPGITASGISDGETLFLYSDSSCSEAEGNISTDGDILSLSGLSEGMSNFYFQIAGDNGSVSDCSKNFISYILDMTAPSAPSISLITLSPNSNRTPTIRAARVSAGDLINIYSSANCTGDIIGSARANTVGAYIDITTQELVDGTYQFYALAVDAAGNVSTCSEASEQYVLSTE